MERELFRLDEISWRGLCEDLIRNLWMSFVFSTKKNLPRKLNAKKTPSEPTAYNAFEYSLQ